MGRRIELPDEVVLSDGSRTRSPEDLATAMETNPEKAAEVVKHLKEGGLEQWADQCGWATLSQQIRKLRTQQPDPQAQALVTILRQFGPRHTVAMNPVIVSISESASLPRNESRISERQRVAIRTFFEANSSRAKSEEQEQTTLRTQETVAQQESARCHQEADQQEALVPKAVNEAQDMLRSIFLPDLWRGLFPLPPLQRATELTLAQSLNQCSAAGQALRAAIDEVRRHRFETSRVRLAIGTAALLVFLGAGIYYLNGIQLFLFIPVVLGVWIAVFRIDQAVKTVDRVQTWAERKRAAMMNSTGRSKSFWKPFLGGIGFIQRNTERITNPYIQAGTRATAAIYFTGSAIGVALMAGYFLAIVAIAIAVLCFVLFIIAKALDG